MKKRFIFFKGLIATLDLYTDVFLELFSAQDTECLVIDAAQIDAEMLRLRAFLLEKVTAVISFHNIGMHLEFEDGKNIWDKYGIPFYNIMMDHPFHYKQALDAAPKQMVLLCMDKNHISYVKRFFPNIRQTMFFPHAGIEQTMIRTQGTTLDRFEARPIDVLYAGGLSRYAAEGLIPDLGRIKQFGAFQLVRDALERLIQEPERTTEDVIEQWLQDQKVCYTDKFLGEIITELRFIDCFAASYYREQTIRMLAEHGIKVTVFGAGWERCEWEHPNFMYGGIVPPVTILELMSRSKIVLNTMTWFKRGTHDRVFNGMLARAAVVSDTSEYMSEHFTDGKELHFFSLNKPQDLVQKVQYLLDNPNDAQRIADCGYQAAKEKHLWKNRWEDLYNHLQNTDETNTRKYMNN